MSAESRIPQSDEVRWQDLADKFLLEHSPEDEPVYFRQQIKRIKEGKDIWMIRNFDSPGQYYDYYVDGLSIGAVHVGEDTRGYEAYFGNERGNNYASLGEAIEAVEQYAQLTREG